METHITDKKRRRDDTGEKGGEVRRVSEKREMGRRKEER